VGTVLLMSFIANPIVFADSPTNLKAPDSHSIEVKGKINLYRVQIEGMKLGKGQEEADAEVFVSLDSTPGAVYTLQIKSDSPSSNEVMANTLRDAYINKLPVTLYHQLALGRKNNFRILMVQLN
jgi:hypothetical protein